GPACFPGNIVPANRIDPNGRALLDLFPVPDRPDLASTGHNYLRQETADNPRLNNVLRLDWKGAGSSSFFGTLRTFSEKQIGSGSTAGPAKWGFYEGTYRSADNSITVGWTKVVGASLVNELSGGLGRRSEGFGVGSDGEWSRLRKSDLGYSLGQF